MGFFDSIVNAADNLGAKVSGNVDAMGINSQVSAKEKEMNNLYAQLGMAYYGIHKDDPDDACRNLVQLLINKEAELNKLKNDLAAKKAETAAIGQQPYNQQGMYQQPMGQPGQFQQGQFQQPMNQPMMGQPMNQPMMGQPMGQPMNQPVMGQPMGQPMNQPVMGQPMGQPMNQPVMGQPMGQPLNQPMQPIVVPVKAEPSEEKKDDAVEKTETEKAESPKAEDADKAADSDKASEDVKTDEAPKTDGEDKAAEPEKKEDDGKTCSVCGATGQKGAFCGNCGSKLG